MYMEFAKTCNLIGTYETIQKILWHIETKTPGLYVRYGDGDFFILNGGEEQLCKATPEFQADMRKSMEEIKEGDMFSCNFHCKELNTTEPYMCFGVFEMFDHDITSIMSDISSINPKIKTIYSLTALHYAMCFQPRVFIDVLKGIQENGNTICMTNKDFSTKDLDYYFGPSLHIQAEGKQSYDSKEDVCAKFEKVLQSINDSFYVCILALGCGGRAMLPALRALIRKTKKNIFIFDFGSPIDVLMRTTTRHWITMVPQLVDSLDLTERMLDTE